MNVITSRVCVTRGLMAAVFSSLFVLLAGCPATKERIDANTSGHVVVKGSNTFGEELAPNIITAYRTQRPNVTVTLESKGSPSGIAALLAKEADVAATSRTATPEEVAQAKARGIVLQEYVIGYYGVAVIVNHTNPVTEMSKQQVSNVFTGKVKNWRELGGLDLPIRLFVRDSASGTNMGFRELAMKNEAYASNAEALPRYAEIVSAVAQNPGAIGYSSMVLADAKGIRALKIGRSEPNQLSVNEGWYPYARMLLLYTNRANETPAARDFVLFVQRGDGQKILDELGFIRRFEKRLKAYEID